MLYVIGVSNVKSLLQVPVGKFAVGRCGGLEPSFSLRASIALEANQILAPQHKFWVVITKRGHFSHPCFT